ncbi:hypothetical protein [Marinibactrum halimedae]|nr:hypothetical protein [Marinibactrum halimedae]MCD9460335.1 hypothetical protein [Marinibactrum halimedae]
MIAYHPVGTIPISSARQILISGRKASLSLIYLSRMLLKNAEKRLEINTFLSPNSPPASDVKAYVLNNETNTKANTKTNNNLHQEGDCV